MVRWSTIDPADDIIEKVFAETPHANIGLRLDQFVVVDCDTKALGTWWFVNGPPTRFQSRGNPDHRSFWYRIDPEDEVRASRRPGIDIKTGPGHYCVIPPSIHPSGKTYQWLDLHPERSDWALPVIRGAEISALLDQLSPERAPVGDGAGWDVVMEGEGRDNFLAAAAGFLRARGASVAAVRAGLAAFNNTFCEPRLPSKDLDRIAVSSGRWSAGEELVMEDEGVRLISRKSKFRR